MSKKTGLAFLFLAAVLSPVMAKSPPPMMAAGSVEQMRAMVAANPVLARHMEAQVLSGAALLKVEKKAQAGDAKAQFDLGSSYINMGILHKAESQKNMTRGLGWYRRAAVLGYAPAETGLAGAYLSGLGVSKSHAKAIKWLRLAVTQKYAPAEAQLGELYLVGRGMPKSRRKGFHWIRLAAGQGDTGSEMILGLMHLMGAEHVVKSYTKAVRWFLLAQADAKKLGVNLPMLASMLKIAEAHLSPAQMIEVRRQVQVQLKAQHSR